MSDSDLQRRSTTIGDGQTQMRVAASGREVPVRGAERERLVLAAAERFVCERAADDAQCELLLAALRKVSDGPTWPLLPVYSSEVFA